MRSMVETNWWVTEYAVDIHNAMKDKEKKRKSVRFRSPQIGFRRHLVEWLEKVCDKHFLSDLTLHLSVMYMDIFMDSHSIETEQLQLVALSCLLVAAKSEEQDILIPKASDLNRTSNDQYRIADFFQMEVALLHFFHWDLVKPTTVHFLDYYAKYVILPSDFIEPPKIFKTMDEGDIYVKKYGDYFKTIAIRETSFLKYNCSTVAASCVASIRICLQLQPYWPKKLHNVTGHSGPSIYHCVELLLRYLEEDEKDLNKSIDDSGVYFGSPSIF